MMFEDKTQHNLKYIQDLADDTTNYVSQIILNVYNGVAENLGIKDPDKLSKNPKKLQKGFLAGIKDIGKKIKGFIGRGAKYSPFRKFKIKGMKIYRKGKPLTQREWNKFEKQMQEYLQPHLDTIAEDLSVKGFLMSLATMQAESQGKDINKFGKKSFEQIEKEQFGGAIPNTIQAAKNRYNLTDYIESAMHLSNARVADYVTKVHNDVRESIKQQVAVAHRTDKSHVKLASDLYWSSDDNPELKQHTAEIKMRDWRRVAHTELSTIHEHGKMMSTEDKAQKSFKGEGNPVYLVFNGPGKCDWCNSHLGTITRQIPLDLVGNEKDDSLQSRGIDDPITNIAVWPGKNNVGFKKQGWRVCSVIHPWSYSRDTQALTSNGWKYFEDIDNTDLIFSMQPETRKLEFVEWEKKSKYHYKDDMILFSAQGYEILVTKNHAIHYMKRVRVRNKPQYFQWKVDKAENLIHNPEFYMPKTGNWFDKDKYELLKDLMNIIVLDWKGVHPKHENISFHRKNNSKISLIPYDGMAYCLTLKTNHILLTKRKGSKYASWSGNCDDSLSVIDIDTQEYDVKNKRIKLKPNKTFEQFIDEDFLQELETEKAEYQARLDRMEKDRNKGIHKRESEYYE